MKAAVLKELRKPLFIEERPIPEVGSDEVLIRVETVGICHSDIHIADGELPPKKLPIILGHEVVGIIEDVGSNVTIRKKGERVGVSYYYWTCGACDECITGNEQNCPNALRTGIDVDGGYAEYMKAKATHTALIPEDLGSIEASSILCSGYTGYSALKDLNIRPGNWVAIFGIGGIGHLAIQYARFMGYNVIAVDIDDSKLKLARELGADETINSRIANPIKYIKEKFGGVPAAICTATAAIAYEQAFYSLKRGGVLAVVGIPPGEFRVPIMSIVRGRSIIKGSGAGTRKDLKDALDIAARMKMKCVTEVMRLDEINDAFDKVRKGRVTGKIVLKVR